MTKKESEENVRRSSYFVYFAAFCSLLDAISGGSALGWTATVFTNMDREDSELRPYNYGNVKHIKSWVASSVTLGALTGGLLCGTLLNSFGRRKSLIIKGIMFIIGWSLIFVAKNVIIVIIGRLVTGFCCGLMCGLIPTYLSEISTPDNRGLLGTGFNLFITLGILLMPTSGLIVSANYLALVALIPAILTIFLMPFMPESPIWIITKFDNKNGEVIDILKKLRHSTSNIEREIEELEQIAKRTRAEEKISLKQLKRPEVYKPFVISMCLIFFLQFSGINAVLFYSTDIMREASGSLPPDISLIIVNVTMVLAIIPGCLLVERLGRKILLILSGLGQAISLGSLGLYYYYAQPFNETNSITNNTLLMSINATQFINNTSQINNVLWIWSPVFCLALFVVSFSVGYGPIPWIIISEISPSFAIGFISSISAAFNWLCAFFITNQFKTINEIATKHGTFWLLCLINILSILFNYFCLPETKGKSLDEMQTYFNRENPLQNNELIGENKSKFTFYENKAFTRL